MKEMKPVKEVAKQLGVSPVTIRSYIKRGLKHEINLVKMGTCGKQKIKFVSLEDVINFRKNM